MANSTTCCLWIRIHALRGGDHCAENQNPDNVADNCVAPLLVNTPWQPQNLPDVGFSVRKTLSDDSPMCHSVRARLE